MVKNIAWIPNVLKQEKERRFIIANYEARLLFISTRIIVEDIWKLIVFFYDIDDTFEGFLSSYMRIVKNGFQVLRFTHELSRKM